MTHRGRCYEAHRLAAGGAENVAGFSNGVERFNRRAIVPQDCQGGFSEEKEIHRPIGCVAAVCLFPEATQTSREQPIYPPHNARFVVG